MKKIAIVVQRYGTEINGGAEYHCRLIAERLQATYDVEVLTSCAVDHLTWANEYQPGKDIVNGIAVRRFPVEHSRDWRRFRKASNRVFKRTVLERLLQTSPKPKVVEQRENTWLIEQGPYTPSLIGYLDENHMRYDALIFFTYLYYPTVLGLSIAPQKSILVPTAHDEKPIYLRIFNAVFTIPQAILYNTKAEKRFVNRIFHNQDIYSEVAGVGIDECETSQSEKSDESYLIYIGRIDPAKGCKLLFTYFLKFIKESGSSLSLVVVGKPAMRIPIHKQIVVKGFVEEAQKRSLLAGAKALIIPSFYESLSLVTLESMACGIPVIANRTCEVLKDHVLQSKAGFLFDDYETFRLSLNKLMAANPTNMAAYGKRYIAENYTWSVTLKKYTDAIEYVSQH